MSEDYPKPIETPALLQQLASDVGGTITECAALPDGSGFAVMSMPLPKTHWLYADDGTYDPPPMPLRKFWLGFERNVVWSREALNEAVRAAARYAIRASTMKGKEIDFDPDAMVQNFVVGLLGYHTTTGLSSDAWEFTPKTDRRIMLTIDRIPPTLYDAAKAKAKREGISLRALVLGWLKEWIDKS